MKIKIITLFPELIQNYLQEALLAKAIAAGLMTVDLINLRRFSDNRYGSVDDSPYGGGDGMLLRADILEKALLSIQSKERQRVIYLSPQGRCYNAAEAKKLSSFNEGEIVLISGRYAGVDQRFIDQYVDEEISIGDYVLSGGELAALVLIESASRYIPGVLGHLDSSTQDSFHRGLLEAPQYTRPQEWNGRAVPEVLLSGHHQKIEDWKNSESVRVTSEKRPDLLKKTGQYET